LTNTTYKDVKGKVKYIHAGNELDKFGAWSITLYPDRESLEYIRGLQAEGLKNVMKKDEENQYYVAFKRTPSETRKGKVITRAKPLVLDAGGKPFDGHHVGWGSDVTVRLEVYKYKTPAGAFGTAARFDSLRVDNLVPWTQEMLPQPEQVKHEALMNSPKPVWD
jgi:hypothetical protein